MRRVAKGVLIALCAYLVLGNLAHRVVFAEPAPDPAAFPAAGHRYSSEAEKLSSEIVAVEDGWVSMITTLAPGAEGPPPHIHETFDEVFVVESGELHIEIEGEVRIVPSGTSVRIPKGTRHRPFNPTEHPVVLGSEEPVMPQSFAACLVQLYPELDTSFGHAMLQLSVMGDICDTHVMPAPVEAATKWLLGPVARLVGFSAFDLDKARAAAPKESPVTLATGGE